MPRILRKLKIAEISTADRGAGEGCQIVLRKADSEATLGFHKDAEGRNVIRIADLAGVAKVLGVKPSRVMKALRKLAKKQAEPKPIAKVIPMPTPPPAPETETPYIKLCKYAAAEARPNETAEQAFARVATTDPRGVDLMTAAKVADVAKLGPTFWPKPLPKEPRVPVVEPASTRTADVKPAVEAPGGGYGKLMQLAHTHQAANGGTIEQAFELMSRQHPDLFQIAKGTYGPDETDPDEVEPDTDNDDEDANLKKLHSLRDGILARNPNPHPGVALEKAMSKPAGRKHYAKYRDGVLGKRR
jgi:hypothetical protein